MIIRAIKFLVVALKPTSILDRNSTAYMSRRASSLLDINVLDAITKLHRRGGYRWRGSRACRRCGGDQGKGCGGRMLVVEFRQIGVIKLVLPDADAYCSRQ